MPKTTTMQSKCACLLFSPTYLLYITGNSLIIQHASIREDRGQLPHQQIAERTGSPGSKSILHEHMFLACKLRFCFLTCLAQNSEFNIALHCIGRGAAAWESFPSCRASIERVQSDHTFEIPDLSWIAATLGSTIRLTMEAETHQALVSNDPFYKDLQVDSTFGCGGVCAHLYFSWRQAIGEDRKFGHFDLLTPRTQTLFSLLLAPDDARSWFGNAFWPFWCHFFPQGFASAFARHP